VATSLRILSGVNVVFMTGFVLNVHNAARRPTNGEVLNENPLPEIKKGFVMKIRALFHNPLGERGVGKWIVRWTWLLGCFYNWKVLKYNFSHEEIWIPDTSLGWVELKTKETGYCERFQEDIIAWSGPCVCGQKFIGQCFSSTTRGDSNGVRFAPAYEVLKHPERWSYIEFDVDPERFEVALEEAKKLVGKKYDFWALFGFFNPFPVQDGKRWYCSEICNWFRVLCGISWHEKRISPRRSVYLLAKKYREPIPLVRQK